MTLCLFQPTYWHPRKQSPWINLNRRLRIQSVGYAHCQEQHIGIRGWVCTVSPINIWEPTLGSSYIRRGKHKISYKGEGLPVVWVQWAPERYAVDCQKHNQTACNKSGVWVSQPCLNLRKDKVLRHSQSDMHIAALEKERLAVIAAVDGGIAQAFEKSVTMQRRALSGSLQILYWLAKMKWLISQSLNGWEVCCDLGCDYFKELNLGQNANHSSHRVIDEWLQFSQI